MTEQELPRIVAGSRLCAGLTEKQVGRLLESEGMQCLQYKRNDILFWTDRAPEHLYMLLKGNTAMARDTASGQRSLSKSTTTPGDLLNEVRLFSERKMLWSYAVALEDSAVLAMPARLFLRPSAIDGEIQTTILHNLIGASVEKIERLGDKVRLLSMPSARKRIACFLFSIQDEHQHILLPSTQEDVADYLGMARPSLSRELGRMQNEGLIQLHGRAVHILDAERFDALLDEIA